MTAQYIIVQYVPDPTADERINFGVIVWDDARVYSTFVSDWSRARHFGGENIAFLKDFAVHVGDLTKQPRSDYQEFSPSRIGNIINAWKDSIQFTAPRGSTRSASELFAELPSMFLRGHAGAPVERAEAVTRGRSVAVKLAYKCVYAVVKARMPEKAKELVRKNESVTGRYYQHEFDVVFANGRPFAAVNALSFEMANRSQLQKDIDATAWIVDDVRMNPKTEDLPLAIYTLPPLGEDDRPLFEKATKAFRGLKADVIVQDEAMSRWTDKQIQSKF